MSYKFKLNNKWYGEKEDSGFHALLYRRINVVLEPGVTILVGCNGSGKTTFLDQLKGDLKRKRTPYLSYDNLRDGGSNAISKAGFYGDFDFLAHQVQSSEGENIDRNIGEFAGKIGNFVYNKLKPEDKTVFLLMDAIDSGLSIDNIQSVKKDLFEFIIQDTQKRGIELYIIACANSYEMAREENCFDVYNATYIKFGDYEEYRSFIIKSRQIKNKRYGIKEDAK